MERLGVMMPVNCVTETERERGFLRGVGFKLEGENMVREPPLKAEADQLRTYTQTCKSHSRI